MLSPLEPPQNQSYCPSFEAGVHAGQQLWAPDAELDSPGPEPARAARCAWHPLSEAWGEMWSVERCVCQSRQRRENNRFVLHPPQVVSAPAGVASKRGLSETANRQVSARADRIIRTVQTQSRCWGGGPVANGCSLDFVWQSRDLVARVHLDGFGQLFGRSIKVKRPE